MRSPVSTASVHANVHGHVHSRRGDNSRGALLASPTRRLVRVKRRVHILLNSFARLPAAALSGHKNRFQFDTNSKRLARADEALWRWQWRRWQWSRLQTHNGTQTSLRQAPIWLLKRRREREKCLATPRRATAWPRMWRRWCGECHLAADAGHDTAERRRSSSAVTGRSKAANIFRRFV